MSPPRRFHSVADMTWQELHERMDYMADVIGRVDENPDSAIDLSVDRVTVEKLFGSEEGLFLALQQRWATALAAKLDQAAEDDIPAEQARAELAARSPGLRALLDEAARRSVRIRGRQRDERRIVELHSGVASRRQTVA
jgi:ATP adenylyltransferase